MYSVCGPLYILMLDLFCVCGLLYILIIPFVDLLCVWSIVCTRRSVLRAVCYHFDC